MIKILLADDHEIVRNILLHLIGKAVDMQVVATAADGQEAVSKAVVHDPHVAVLDISMPVMDGIEATRQINARCPETRVLIFSTYNTPVYIRQSVEAGASGYVVKDEVGSELVTAIYAVHRGKRYFSHQVSELAKLYIE
jgi:two-component system nitrate/nitrite response regulator NarL